MKKDRKNVVVCGEFDDIRSLDIRFMHEASKYGLLYVFLWNDELIKSETGRNPDFPLNEEQK